MKWGIIVQGGNTPKGVFRLCSVNSPTEAEARARVPLGYPIVRVWPLEYLEKLGYHAYMALEQFQDFVKYHDLTRQATAPAPPAASRKPPAVCPPECKYDSTRPAPFNPELAWEATMLASGDATFARAKPKRPAGEVPDGAEFTVRATAKMVWPVDEGTLLWGRDVGDRELIAEGYINVWIDEEWKLASSSEYVVVG